MPIQWIITLFACFAAWRAWTALRSAAIDRRKFLFWTLFWIAVVVVIWQPQTTSVLAAELGVGRGVDLALYLSVIVLFYALFQVSRKVDRLNRSLTELVRTLALHDAPDDRDE